MKKIKIILRFLLGATFIASAIMKCLTLDEFEIYIHSFGLFNYTLCTFLARLLISLEFLLGFFLMLKVKYRITWWLSMLTMTGFTFFLLYVFLFRNDTNCHCFGSIIEVNPLDSIIKNIIIILLLLPVRNENDYRFRFKKLVVGITITASVSVPFFVIPPDVLYNKVASIFNKEAANSEINETSFVELFQDSTMQNIKLNDNQIIAVYSAGCKFCKLGMKKVKSIFEKNCIPPENLTVIILGSTEYILKFQQETESQDFIFHSVTEVEVAKKMFKTIYGAFPTFIYVENGQPVKAANLRSLYENDIVDFLLKENIKQ